MRLRRTTYYRERGGSYLVVWPENGRRPTTIKGEYLYDGRAVTLDHGGPWSVGSCSVSSGYLRTCRRVDVRAVPRAWRRVLAPE